MRLEPPPLRARLESPPLKMPSSKMAEIELEDKSKWPKMQIGGVLHWGGGRIYLNTPKTGFRAYRRAGDKVEKSVGFGRKPTMDQKQTAWLNALHVIVDDPRPRRC